MKSPQVKLTLLVSVALICVGACASLPAGASAAGEWFVGGSPLTGSAGLSATVTTPVVVVVPTVKLKVECPTAKFNKLEIFGVNQSKVENINFEKCKVIEPAGCTLVVQEIKTESISLVPTVGPGKSVTLVKSAVHGTIISVSLSENCGSLANANIPFTGKVTTVAPTLQEERTEQKVKFIGEESKGLFAEIKKEKLPAFVTGELAEHLTVSEKSEWSFH